MLEQKVEKLTLEIIKLEKRLKTKDRVTVIMWVSFLVFLLLLTIFS